jgi:pimeloyl-ACP methyl ester carboxylesterase
MILPLLLAATLAQPAFSTRPCTGELAADPTVTCGTVRVPENRSQTGGRSIELNVVVLRATGSKPDLPPLFDIEGGPGLPATVGSAFYRTDGLPYRARRDVVLFDQRGTGASNPLTCPPLDAREAALAPMYPLAEVARCRDSLVERADLTQYGTMAAVADLDDVRAALGHERIDVVAISYGTTLTLRYLASYPGRVRAAVLSGVVPASAMPPQHHAAVAEAALDRLFADCAHEPACRAAFPRLDQDLREAMRRLDRGDGPAAGPGGATLSTSVFMERLRALMYGAKTARTVPRIVHSAARGDFAPFLETLDGAGSETFSEGLYLSITCAESFGAMNFARAVTESRATRFGDYRLRRQRDACALWPTAKVDSGFHRPVSSDAQILLISGARDPVTPAAWAAAAARTLPHSRRVVVPWAGHTIDGLSAIETCYDPMLLRFFDAGDVHAVDTVCVSAMLPPPFAGAAGGL